MTFFRPTPAFIEWMLQYKAVIDVGCGYGDLVRAVNDAGGNAIGIDIDDYKITEAMERARTDEQLLTMGRLVCGDSTTSKVVQLPGATLVFARPCHGTGWIRQTVEHTRETAERWLYVGKEGNVASDLHGFERRRHLVGVAVGTDGEQVWEFRLPSEDYEVRAPARWCLVRFSTETVWVRDGKTCWYWGWGPSRVSKTELNVVLEDAWVVDEEWLDFKKTTTWQEWNERVNDKSLDNGWLSPEGRLYRCAYWEHDKVAYDYLRIDPQKLADTGWCKIQSAISMRRGIRFHFVMGYRDRDHRVDHRLTKEQVQTLLDVGYKLPAYLLDGAEGDWSHVEPDEDW